MPSCAMRRGDRPVDNRDPSLRDLWMNPGRPRESRPALSRIVTSPCGKTAVRLNGAAIDTTGSLAYCVPANALLTVSVCTTTAGRDI